MTMLRKLEIAKKTCQHLANYRQTEGMIKLCQAVNRLWQDYLNAEMNYGKIPRY